MNDLYDLVFLTHCLIKYKFVGDRLWLVEKKFNWSDPEKPTFGEKWIDFTVRRTKFLCVPKGLN